MSTALSCVVCSNLLAATALELLARKHGKLLLGKSLSLVRLADAWPRPIAMAQ